ncbi:MAG: putative immunity protein [Pseudonocardiaceae bacterium]
MDKGHSTTTGSEEGRRLLTQWASDCAEHVPPLFEAPHSGEARRVASAAHAAARSTTDTAARASARSTGQAAATAHMGGHARHAANYAATAVTHASSGDSEAGAREQAWQYQRIPESVRTLAYPNGDPGSIDPHLVTARSIIPTHGDDDEMLLDA